MPGAVRLGRTLCRAQEAVDVKSNVTLRFLQLRRGHS